MLRLVILLAALVIFGAAPVAARGREAGRGMPSIVAEAARHHGVPVRLALGVAAVESGFRSGVRSVAGAIGLMQIMPATARGLGCRGSLLSATANADCGARYLARLLRRCRGDARRAAALYSVGEYGEPSRGAAYAARVTHAAARIADAGK